MAKITRREFLKAGGVAGALGLGGWLLGRGIRSRVVTSANKRLKVLFHFGAHSTPEQAEEAVLTVMNFKPHVVCPEHAFATEQEARETEKMYYHPNIRFYSPHADALRDALVQLGKPKIFVLERFTPEQGRHLLDLDNRSDANRGAARLMFLLGNPAKAIEMFRQHLQDWTELHMERENAIKRILSDFHRRLVERYPDLAREKEIRVVVSYGSAHTPLYMHGKNSGFGQVTRYVPAPTYFISSDAHVRRATFGKKPKYGDEEVAQALLSEVLTIRAMQQGAGNSNAAAFGNIAARRFSLADIANLSREMGRDFVGRRTVFERHLQQRGIPFPASAEQVRDFLRKKRIPLAEG